ncbi:hypothetical protein IWQ57_002202 [Coemansia nantahalensis]|uniref:Uncharacterized protein n=1 Tax=Coemansia nantahalensis TaxID=2789366 RepID=A0ACC1K152_9FUNG|nr:hypothetical protein IWQ57_002202 [Coemansia nantahalensis]
MVDHYVDNQWQGRDTCPDLEAFKKQLLRGFIEHFDGYRIGRVPHIFNPHAVLEFLSDLEDKMPDTVSFGDTRDWVDTACLWMVMKIQLASMGDHDRYFKRLVENYYLERVSAEVGGAVAVLERASSLDEAIGLIGAEEDPQQLTGDAFAVDKELADICTKSRAKDFLELLALGEQDISARAAMLLFYQAGYIAPRTDGRMAIPSTEVFKELKRYHRVVSERHNRRSCLPDDTHALMGIRDGNLVRFAVSLHGILALMTGLSSKKAEIDYQHIVTAFLGPVRDIGFDLMCEANAGSGYVDVVVIPRADHSRHGGTSRMYVFELKRHPRGEDSYAKLMSLDQRISVEQPVRDLAIVGHIQTRDRYLQNAMVRARGCEELVLASVAFWMHRVYMVVRRFRSQRQNQSQVNDWAPLPYSDTDIQDAPGQSIWAMVVDGNIEISTIVSAAEWPE